MKSLAAFLSSLLLTGSVLAAELDVTRLGKELAMLNQQGVTGLASALLDQAEPDRLNQPQLWQQWHRQKLAGLIQQGQWQAVIAEYEAQVGQVDPLYSSWLSLQSIRAYISLGRGEQARDLLLPLLWRDAPDADRVSELRRLVLHSYLVDGRIDNARTAVRRYELDYADAELDSAWLALKARSLIAQDKANEAAILTVVSDQPEVKAIYSLALLSGLTRLDETLWQDGLHWLAQSELDQEYHECLFSALFNKAKQLDNLGLRVRYLQKLLQIGGRDSAQQVALVDALWFAYEAYGQKVANQQQLLIGNFEPWLVLAGQFQNEAPFKSEALYAWLAVNVDDVNISSQAHDLFVSRLISQGRTYAVRPLYLSATRFSEVALPTVLTYRLIDLALAEGDLIQASKLMSQMDAFEGVNVMAWQLRRARLQILTGVSQYGIELLQQVVDADSLSLSQVEYLILATQDLKQKSKYEEAYILLAQLLNKAPDTSMNQQLLFWMADCREGQQRYTDAALLYLQAAAQSKNDWSLAAYQRAAEVLQQAGQIDDALHLYTQLWQMTGGSQRLLYQAKIQDLKLSN